MEHPDADGGPGRLSGVATLPPIDRVTCRAIVQSLPQAVVLLDAELRVVFGNANAALLFDVDARELRGHPITFLIPDSRLPLYLTEFGAARRRVMESSIPGATPEAPARTLKIEALRLALAPGPPGGGVATLAGEDAQLLVIDDISNRVVLERQLIDSEKRAAAGEAATAILTEAAEPIAVLGAKLMFVRTALDAMEPEDVKQALDSAFDQLDFLRLLLARMSGFAESGLTQPRPVESPGT